MFVSAIIAAGGRGVRFGADRPKQFLEVGGRSILKTSVGALAASDRVHEIIVALPEEYLAEVAKAWAASSKPLAFVAGGARRQDSVANAFARSSGRVMLNDPRWDLASGVRLLATMTASLIGLV